VVSSSFSFLLTFMNSFICFFSMRASSSFCSWALSLLSCQYPLMSAAGPWIHPTFMLKDYLFEELEASYQGRQEKVRSSLFDKLLYRWIYLAESLPDFLGTNMNCTNRGTFTK
jgi:hypothetical protein